MAVQELTAVEQRGYRRRGHLARAWSRLLRKKLAVASMIVLVVVYSLGILAPLVAPYSYQQRDLSAMRSPPTLATDHGITGIWTHSHLAGTDRAGRDVFTRVLWGIQNTVVLTFVAMATGGLVIGVSLGLISGYYGKWTDAVIMRTGEVFASFPDILLAIILAATLRPRFLDWVRWLEDNTFLSGVESSGVVDYLVISLALVSFGWIGMARLVRAQVLYLKETQHVEAARAIGASTARIMFVHLLPNAISPIVVTVTMGMASFIFAEIALSWLGLGIQPPRPSLGRMLFDGAHISVLRNDPWMLFAPGIAVGLLVLSWNLLGDALNDVLNPRTR